MAGNQRKPTRRTIAVEVCHSHIHAAVAEFGRDGNICFRTRSVAWRDEATSLHGERGVHELTDAFRQMASEFDVEGACVYVALDGDLCVTRVVTGTQQHVRNELDQLAERSARYLSLGHGPKATGESVRAIDARHQHGLLAVANERSLEALVDAFRKAGLKPELIEPSLVSLCRFVGRTGRDHENPVLLVKLGKGGLEVAISYQGQLMLHYRPGGHLSEDGASAIVAKHLGRLQRYCDRYLRLSHGRLQRVLLCGERETVERVGASFAQRSTLDVEVLAPSCVDTAWQFEQQDAQPPGAVLAPVVGTTLLGIEHDTASPGPDLLASVVERDRKPLLAFLLRAFWPLAAAILLAVVLFALGAYEKGRCRFLEREMASFGLDQDHANLLLAEVRRDRELLEHYDRIRRNLPDQAYGELVTTIGQCLSDDAHLDSFRVDVRGHVVLQGVCSTEQGIFDFIQSLREYPALQRVALHSTTPAATGGRASLHFHIECDCADYAGGGGNTGDEVES